MAINDITDEKIRYLKNNSSDSCIMRINSYCYTEVFYKSPLDMLCEQSMGEIQYTNEKIVGVFVKE